MPNIIKQLEVAGVAYDLQAQYAPKTPSSDEDSASKYYVDHKKLKLYSHTVVFSYYNSADETEFVVSFKIFSFVATQITTLSGLWGYLTDGLISLTKLPNDTPYLYTDSYGREQVIEAKPFENDGGDKVMFLITDGNSMYQYMLEDSDVQLTITDTVYQFEIG